MSDSLANSLTVASTGLQTKEDYKRKREEIQLAATLGAPAPAAASASAGTDKKKKKKKAASASVLSFGDELEEEATSPRFQAKGMGKDQSSNVSFLKLNDREAVEAAQAQQVAKRGYLVLQQKAKTEPITLSYTFRSEVTQRELPTGVHQGSITTTKGTTTVGAQPTSPQSALLHRRRARLPSSLPTPPIPRAPTHRRRLPVWCGRRWRRWARSSSCQRSRA